MQQFLGIGPAQSKFHASVARAAQTAEHLFVGNAHSGHILAVDLYDTVAGKHAHLLGRAAGNHFNNLDGIVVDHKLDTDTTERAFKVVVHSLQVGRRNIGGVRVEVREQTGNRQFNKAVEVHVIHIVVADEIEYSLEFLLGCGRTALAVNPFAG